MVKMFNSLRKIKIMTKDHINHSKILNSDLMFIDLDSPIDSVSDEDIRLRRQ